MSKETLVMDKYTTTSIITDISTELSNRIKALEIKVEDLILLFNLKLDTLNKDIAEFEKVSYDQFKKDLIKLGYTFTEEEMKQYYDDIKLPVRATVDSAGHDFVAPFTFTIPKEVNPVVAFIRKLFKKEVKYGIVIPTGIRCKINSGWVLETYPRSGQGFKYGVFEYNTVGIIDGDYYNAKNEGHIMIKLGARVDDLTVVKGTGFCQGLFKMYGTTNGDNVTTLRTGGLGSTTESSK